MHRGGTFTNSLMLGACKRLVTKLIPKSRFDSSVASHTRRERAEEAQELLRSTHAGQKVRAKIRMSLVIPPTKGIRGSNLVVLIIRSRVRACLCLASLRFVAVWWFSNAQVMRFTLTSDEEVAPLTVITRILNQVQHRKALSIHQGRSVEQRAEAALPTSEELATLVSTARGHPTYSVVTCGIAAIVTVAGWTERASTAFCDAGIAEVLVGGIHLFSPPPPEGGGPAATDPNEDHLPFVWEALSSLLVGCVERNVRRVAHAGGVTAAIELMPSLLVRTSPPTVAASHAAYIVATSMHVLKTQKTTFVAAGALKVR